MRKNVVHSFLIFVLESIVTMAYVLNPKDENCINSFLLIGFSMLKETFVYIMNEKREQEEKE